MHRRFRFCCTSRSVVISAAADGPSILAHGEHIMDRTTAVRSTAFTTVDLDKPGKQVGFVMIPHSPNDDAWGVTRVPIAIISNGKGPTVIVEGGNHGDEYE